MLARLGIGGRLFLAFAGIMGLSLVSGLVGWLELRQVARTQATVTDIAMPAAIEARGVAEASARLIATSPLLTGAATEAERERGAAALFADARQLRQMLADLARYGFDAAAMAGLERSVDRLLQNLAAQDGLVAERIRLRAAAEARLSEALEAALGLFDLSETLVANAAADTTAVISYLYDLVEDPAQLERTFEALDRLVERDVYLLERMFELRLRSSQMGLLFNQLGKAAQAAEIGWLEETLGQNLQIVRRRIDGIPDPVRREQAEDLFAQLSRATVGAGEPSLFAVWRTMLETDRRIEGLAGENRRLSDELGALVVDLVKESQALTASATRQADAAVRIGLWTLLGVTGASLLVALLILWLYVRRSVVTRLRHLAGLMRDLARGRLDVEVEATGSDELTEMAGAIRFFKEEAIRKRELERERERTEIELRRHKEELEELVRERTLRLSDANRRLQREVEEHDKARARAEQASRAKSEFLATMSHEIRTPMNGMLGMLRVLGESALGPAQRQQLEIVASSGEALLAILNDILDYSKIESGRLELEETDFDLRRLIDGILSLMQPRAAEKGLALGVAYGEDVPALLKGDAAKLRQILFNLIGNGLKFTERGGVTLSVERLPPAEAMPLGLRFEVADTGIGLPADKKDMVFDAFFQVDTSISRRYGGTGLGLAICRRLIDALGGRIGVESVLGEGSRFWFTLGFRPGEAAAAARLDRPAADGYAAIGARSILVVEDNEVNRLVACAFLESMGHRVTAVADGRQAIEAVERTDFDAVLMDISLPVMNGLEATRRIRALADPRKSRLPIIAMSAHVFRSEIDQHLQAGMDAFIGKPMSPERLGQVLSEVLEGGRAVSLPPPPAGEDAPWILRDSLAEDLEILGPERMQRMIALFGTEAPDRLRALGAAVAEADADAAAFAAHALKNAAGSLGLARLAGCLEALEAAARAGRTADLAMLHRELAAVYETSLRLLLESWEELQEAARPLRPAAAGAA